VAVGLLIGDTPGASAAEVRAVFRVAAREGASVHVHMRAVTADDDTSDIAEVLSDARATGASLHVVHLPSTAQELTPRYLAMIAAARARGLDVTTEFYPYTTGMAEIDGALYDGWEQKPDAWFARKEWPPTGERLTRETFARYRAQGGYVVTHATDEAAAESWVRAALASPFAVIATDGILDHGVGHPRTASSFARVLGRSVREQRVLDLMDALRKMTLLPAGRLERRVPAMRRKGRIAVGMDADVVVFDPQRIIDRATYREPTLPPVGMVCVIVNGWVVVRGGRLAEGIFPGQAVRAPVSEARASR
jgi:dihydroorotase